MTLGMKPETFKCFREMIYARSGLDFIESKKYLLESRLRPRLTAVHCQTYEEYYNYLRFDPHREKELIELFNCVTTNETFFFRDSAQVDCFRQSILPQAIHAREKVRKLRIWSAGCSSGEEPFTLAMVMTEEFPALAGWHVEILATDLSEQVLASARRGVYGPYSVRYVPSAYLKKYFTTKDGQYTVGPDLRKMVTFSSLNLYDAFRMRAFRDIDVIFCRNVLIYFDQEARRKIVTSFYDALHDQGVLMIGFSESLSGVNRLFRPIPWNKTVIYRKAGEGVSIQPSRAIAGFNQSVHHGGGRRDTPSHSVSPQPSQPTPLHTSASVSGKRLVLDGATEAES